MFDRAKKFLLRCSQSATKFLLTQLCVTLISWPLMLSWGIPVALLSPVGNMIFNPFVVFFLALSALITGAEICHLPHGFLCLLLEWLTTAWIWLIDLIPPTYVLTLKKPPLVLALIAPIVTVAVMHSRRIRGRWKKIGTLTGLFFLLTLLFTFLPGQKSADVPYGSSQIHLEQKRDGKIYATDTGFIRKKTGIDSWLTFSLLPQLSIAFGRQDIDVYAVKKLTPGIVIFIQTLCEKRLVRSLKIPQETHQNKKLRDSVIAYATKNKISLV